VLFFIGAPFYSVNAKGVSRDDCKIYAVHRGAT
jgi:hypothetical protein